MWVAGRQGDIGRVVANGGGGPRALNHQFVMAEEVVMGNRECQGKLGDRESRWRHRTFSER